MIGRTINIGSKDGGKFDCYLVTPETEYYNFAPGTRADLKPGETIFSGARVDGEGKFSTGRVAVSKDGVKPPQ